MQATQTHQDALRCVSCAGQTRFDPASGALICASCGTAHEIDPGDTADAARELPFDGKAALPEAPRVLQERAHSCTACGGTVIFSGAALSEACPYCDGPVVMALQDAGFETMAMIPFQTPQSRAAGAVQTWIKGRIAAPSDLALTVQSGTLAALYAPFWTFDSTEALEYWARYTVKQGDRRVIRSVSNRTRKVFDDLLVPASPHVTPLLRDGVLHAFRPEALRAYRPEFLAGFASEGHHESVAYGLRAAETDKDLLIRNHIKRDIGKRGVFDIRYRTDTTGIRYRRILLPMWIHHYTYGDKAYRVVVSGIDGRTFGERPLSTVKLLGYAAAISALALGTGVLYGLAGLL